ncbi:hypothetical protein F5Y19DRAFT_482440 [Xylariaceae sp. FL1651]|nr:hypothetical protein F5Y19DRAFT_482440 [Xylariaceae sp. FL1651]
MSWQPNLVRNGWETQRPGRGSDTRQEMTDAEFEHVDQLVPETLQTYGCPSCLVDEERVGGDAVCSTCNTPMNLTGLLYEAREHSTSASSSSLHNVDSFPNLHHVNSASSLHHVDSTPTLHHVNSVSSSASSLHRLDSFPGIHYCDSIPHLYYVNSVHSSASSLYHIDSVHNLLHVDSSFSLHHVNSVPNLHYVNSVPNLHHVNSAINLHHVNPAYENLHPATLAMAHLRPALPTSATHTMQYLRGQQLYSATESAQMQQPPTLAQPPSPALVPSQAKPAQMTQHFPTA